MDNFPNSLLRPNELVICFVKKINIQNLYIRTVLLQQSEPCGGFSLLMPEIPPLQKCSQTSAGFLKGNGAPDRLTQIKVLLFFCYRHH